MSYLLEETSHLFDFKNGMYLLVCWMSYLVY